MICAGCGAENPSNNLFCGKCGDALSTPELEPRYSPRSVTLRRELTILALGLLLMTGAAFGAWYGMFYQRSPAMVVRRFIDADLQDQFSRQPQYLVDRWDSRMVLSAFQVIRQKTGSSPFKSCRIMGYSESGSTAYVNVQLSFTLPAVPGVNTPLNAAAPAVATNVPIAFVLTSQNGEWKIDGSQTLANAAGALAAVGYTQLAPLMNGVPNIKLPGFSLPGAPAAGMPAVTPSPSQPGSAPSAAL